MSAKRVEVLAAVALVAIAGGAAVTVSDPAPAVAATTPTFVGAITSCSDTVGSVVAVNFAGADVAPFGVEDDWGGPVALGCDTSHPAHGINLLTDTGFTTAGDQHDGPQFVCRIGSSLYENGTQHPTPAQDPCVVTPPSSAYWSYWLADAGATTWTYSPLGAYSDVPEAGEVEAWTFGQTNVQGTNGQPPFTPAQVRAQETATTSTTPTGGGTGTTTSTGAPAPTAATPSSPTTTTTSVPTTGSGRSTATPRPRQAAHRPALARGVHYLVTTTGANGLTGGTSLAADGYYESAKGFADFGLTIDGAFALAATRDDPAVLRRVVAFLAAPGRDGSGRTVNTWTEIGTADAASGAIGKEALLAEVVGRNPRRFAGHDLIAALDRLICRARDASSCAGGPGSYENASSTFDETLAIIAQLRAHDGRHARPAIAYLERHQHRSGAWPSLIPSTGDSDVDSTAMAAMALALVPGRTAQRAVVRADRWIAHRQERDGGFPGAAGDSTNSTGLAIQALRLQGRRCTRDVARGLAFLASAQNADGGFDIAAAGTRGSDVRASTQVIGGAVGTSFGTLTTRRRSRRR